MQLHRKALARAVVATDFILAKWDIADGLAHGSNNRDQQVRADREPRC